MYHSRELRDAAAKTVVHESSRGFRLGKSKGSDRVDPIIALAMAVLMTGRQESLGGDYDVRNFWSGERPDDPAVDQAYAWALADYRKALDEYRQRKSGATTQS